MDKEALFFGKNPPNHEFLRQDVTWKAGSEVFWPPATRGGENRKGKANQLVPIPDATWDWSIYLHLAEIYAIM